MQSLDYGVDVAKESVVAACATEGKPREIRNSSCALRSWLGTLPPGSRIGMESTGRFHRQLADLAHGMGFTVYVLNARDIHYYSKGLGRRGKTDRVDAEVLARYVAKEHDKLHPYVPPTEAQEAIDRLLRRRAKIVVLKGALRASGEDLEECQSQIDEALEKLDALIASMNQRLKTLIQGSGAHRQIQQRLQTIVGVGPLVSTSLANVFSRLTFRSSDAFIAYTGFDPRPFDSGQKVGRRRLSKRGPSELRRLLFIAAMAASKTRVWKPTYERYRARGLPSTAAMVILARRIARVAWSVHSHQTDFDPARLAA
jgi:transposase